MKQHGLNIVVTVPKNQSMTMSGGAMTHNRSVTVSDGQQRNEVHREKVVPPPSMMGNLNVSRLIDSKPEPQSRSSALAVDDSFDDEIDSSNLTESRRPRGVADLVNHHHDGDDDEKVDGNKVRKSSVSLLSFVERQQHRVCELTESQDVSQCTESPASRTTLTFPRAQLYDVPESHDLDMGPSLQTTTTKSSVPVQLQSISAMSDRTETLKTRITQQTVEDVSDCYASTNPPVMSDHGIHVHGTPHSGFTGGTTSKPNDPHAHVHAHGLGTLVHSHHLHRRGKAYLRFSGADGGELLTVQRARNQLASQRTLSSTETSAGTSHSISGSTDLDSSYTSCTSPGTESTEKNL